VLKSKVEWALSVLTVGGDELAMGDDEVASLEVVRGCRCATSPREGHVPRGNPRKEDDPD
jgi:hypothetical protein